MSALQIAYDCGLISCPASVSVAGGVRTADVVFRHRQHAARARRRVVDGAHDVRLREGVGLRRQQDVDHQLDHVARGEVLSGRLVRRLRELADQLLEDVPHLLVRHRRRGEVDACELLRDEEEEVMLVELRDAVRHLVLVEDVLHVVGEAGHVVEQVRGEVLRVAQRAGEVEPRLVPEGVSVPRLVLEQRRAHGDAVRFRLLDRSKDGLLGRREHGIQPAQHGERKDDVAVLVRLEAPTEQIGDGPDEVGVVVAQESVPLVGQHLEAYAGTSVTGAEPRTPMRGRGA